MTFGEKLKCIRQEKGMKQKDLGDIMGVSQQAIARLENSNNFPHKSTIAQIAKALNISTEIFIDGNFTNDENQKIESADVIFNTNFCENSSKLLDILRNITELSPEGLRELDHFIENMLLTNPRYRKSR